MYASVCVKSLLGSAEGFLSVSVRGVSMLLLSAIKAESAD